MRRKWTVLAGLAVVLAFVIFARTGGPATPTSAPAASTGSGGGGLPLGAPQSGPPGSGFAVVSDGGSERRYTFQQVSCIRSPNSPDGLLAKGISDPASPTPTSIGVATDDSTLSPIELRISAARSWSAGQGTTAPDIRRTGKTVTFSGRLRPTDAGTPVEVRGSLTCGTITTLG